MKIGGEHSKFKGLAAVGQTPQGDSYRGRENSYTPALRTELNGFDLAGTRPRVGARARERANYKRSDVN